MLYDFSLNIKFNFFKHKIQNQAKLIHSVRGQVRGDCWDASCASQEAHLVIK